MVLGFALRVNPLLCVVAAVFAMGVSTHHAFVQILGMIGSGFLKARALPLILILPIAVVGLLERHGLREFAQGWIHRFKAATIGRILVSYLLVRQLTAALGLTSLGGHVQMVRPILAPMVEATAERAHGPLDDEARYRLRACSAATDTMGLVFGEDIFVAFGAIVLMHTLLKQAGLDVDPMHIALWGIPTALCAFFIHGGRMLTLDRWLSRRQAAGLAVAE